MNYNYYVNMPTSIRTNRFAFKVILDSYLNLLYLYCHDYIVTTVFQKLNSLKPSGHYMYHQFSIHKSYVLPTQCIYVFCVDLRTNSDYFHIQH